MQEINLEADIKIIESGDALTEMSLDSFFTIFDAQVNSIKAQKMNIEVQKMEKIERFILDFFNFEEKNQAYILEKIGKKSTRSSESFDDTFIELIPTCRGL